MSTPIPTPYEDLLRDVLANGSHKSDRTGTGTRSVFGRQLRFDLAQGFPLITTKRVHFKSIAYELLWFLRGESNVGWLREQRRDHLGRVGRRARRARPGLRRAMAVVAGAGRTHIDQIQQAIDTLRRDPDSRRIIVSAWNVADIPDMALAPCHAFFQFYVADGKLSCQLYQRSADMFLGVPFNIASYALLTHDGRAAGRARAGRLRLDGRRLPHLRQPRRAGDRAAHARPVSGADPALRTHAARASSTTGSRTSRSRITSTTRRSGRPSPYDASRSIWAQAHNRVIGADGVMPWHLPEDLAHFRELTGGDPVVMGRRTWESLPERFRPLPGRDNIVVTRQPGFDAPGATVVHSLEAALTGHDRATVWVIGGAELYSQALPLADRVEVTEIDLDVAGDTVAPALGPEWRADPGAWLEATNGMRYRFVRNLR